jgi:hypothetical protein
MLYPSPTGVQLLKHRAPDTGATPLQLLPWHSILFIELADEQDPGDES